MKSWKTTTAAILGILIYLAGQFDLSIADVKDWGEVVGVLGGMLGIGFFSRDDDVTSERSGAAAKAAKGG